jgi:uncharacterized protein
MIPPRLTAVTLGSRDLPSLRSFYEAMGWSSRPGSNDEFTAFDAAVAAGARSVAPPQDREWGGRSGYVSDPEDNRWEIAWAPGFQLTETGAVAGP